MQFNTMARTMLAVGLMSSIGLLMGGGANAENANARASAAAKAESLIDRNFKTADKDGDLRLTLAEASDPKTGMPRVAKNFARLDSDKKGFLTLEQIKKASDGKD